MTRDSSIAPATVKRYGRGQTKSLPPTPRLRELFEYDPLTGSLTWRIGRNAGKPAGHVPNRQGHLRVMVDGVAYMLHRVIWKFCAWADPVDEIDHVNGDGGDNRWLNLRPCTAIQNGKNRCININNTSGFKGVSWHRRQQQWSAQIRADGQKLHLGYFDDLNEADLAYRKAADLYHGEFARAT